jgi:hypothetical protein
MVDAMPDEHDFPLWPDNPTAEDLLGFEDVAAPIVDALKRDRLDPVALGIFGDWGSGKTTVLETRPSRPPVGQDDRGDLHAAVGIRPID